MAAKLSIVIIIIYLVIVNFTKKKIYIIYILSKLLGIRQVVCRDCGRGRFVPRFGTPVLVFCPVRGQTRVLWGNRFFFPCTRHVSMYLRPGIVIHSFCRSVPRGIIFY